MMPSVMSSDEIKTSGSNGQTAVIFMRKVLPMGNSTRVQSWSYT